MFLADGEEMPRPGPPWEGCPCSHPASSSPFGQGASSPPQKRGITAWAVPLWSGHLYLLSVSSSWEQLEGRPLVTTSGWQSDAWSRQLCVSGAQHLSAELAGDQTPVIMRAKRVWGLDDERQGLIMSSCKAAPCGLRAPTAGLSSTQEDPG